MEETKKQHMKNEMKPNASTTCRIKVWWIEGNQERLCAVWKNKTILHKEEGDNRKKITEKCKV